MTTSELEKPKQVYVSQTWYKVFAEFTITFIWVLFLDTDFTILETFYFKFFISLETICETLKAKYRDEFRPYLLPLTKVL